MWKLYNDLKGDGPYQTVMIVCGCIWFSYIITLHIMRLLCFLAKVSHTTHTVFATLDTIYRYNVIWPFKVTLVLVWVLFKKIKIKIVFCFKKSKNFEFCIFFYSLYVRSILLSCSSHRSMVPYSPYSLYLVVMFFLWVYGSFWLSMLFDNRVKKGEKFEFWMSFLRWSNRFRGRNSC